MNVRDHGLPDPGDPVEPPKLISKQPVDAKCPNCGGETMFMIEVHLQDETEVSALLKGDGDPYGTYTGCAACPYASPMMAARRG